MNTQSLRPRSTFFSSIGAALFAAAIAFTADVHAQSLVVSNLWSISTADSRSYVSATTTERGVAYNPLLNFAYIVSRNGTPAKIARVNAMDGSDLGVLDTN